MAIYQNSSFSRTKENEMKMGAYFTDLKHCEDIAKMFIWPQGEEVCVLEPSIGDGRAVITVTDAAHNSGIKIFGVELNDRQAQETKQNNLICEVLNADFVDGVSIGKESFSFCFGNPPYMSEKNDSGEDNIRLERVFLDKVVRYLKPGSILVWVVPFSSFSENSYLRLWMRDFDTEAIYKFREEEYAKYHQVVVVGKRVNRRSILLSQIEQYAIDWNLSDLPILPGDLKPTIVVPPSKEEDVTIFTTKEFDTAKAYELLGNGLSPELKVAFDKRVSIKPHVGNKLLRPPIPLKKDSLYLLATSGYGQGLTGNEEQGDLHLQRGIAEVVEESHYSDSDYDGDYEKQSSTVTVTSRTKVTMRVLQNDGTITVLE